MIRSLVGRIELSNLEEISVIVENSEVFIERQNDYGDHVADLTLSVVSFSTEEIPLPIILTIADEINLDTQLAMELVEHIYDMVQIIL
ncbi:hypothetical protein [Cronobacter phage vB_Cdu_VP8]|nr:hypothetical protein [Cronobacter phage vB_Cdu_VP8]